VSNKDLARHLAEVPLFSKCTKRELATIARHAETTVLEDGVLLTTEGEPGDAFFVILSGHASVQRGGKPVAELGAGDWFGELALLDGRPRSATVTAVGDVEVAVLGVRMFRTLLREVPDLTEQLLAGMAGQLRDSLAPDEP
jgi:CRP-like cAMP-binding protein